jgi:hypothetical protein
VWFDQLGVPACGEAAALQQLPQQYVHYALLARAFGSQCEQLSLHRTP